MVFGFKKKTLEEKQTEAQEKLDAKLAVAAEDGDLSKMKSLISQGANPNAGLYSAAKYGREWPALRGGYAYDSINPMALLLDKGADVNASLLIYEGAKYTPLSTSLDSGHVRLAKFLMGKGGRISDLGGNALVSSTGWKTFLKIGDFTQYSEAEVRRFIRKKESSEAAARASVPGRQSGWKVQISIGGGQRGSTGDGMSSGDPAIAKGFYGDHWRES